MIAKLYALAACGVLALTGYADTCRSATCAQRQAVAAAVVVTAPSLVTVPLYGASYTGDGSKSDADLLAALQAILAKLDAIDARLAAQGGSPGPFKAAGAAPLDPIKVRSVKCARCHTDGPNVKGDFVMFDSTGLALKLNGPDERSIQEKVKKGLMPPDEKLSPEVKDAVMTRPVDAPAPKK